MSASFALYGEVETRNESTKQKNGIFWKGFNLTYKLPIELMHGEALKRPPITTTVFLAS